MYKVEVSSAGSRSIDRLPRKVRAAVAETIFGTLTENPRRIAKPLRGEFEGLMVARRGDYRIIFRIDEAQRAIKIYRVQHRRTAYRAS